MLILQSFTIGSKKEKMRKMIVSCHNHNGPKKFKKNHPEKKKTPGLWIAGEFFKLALLLNLFCLVLLGTKMLIIS